MSRTPRFRGATVLLLALGVAASPRPGLAAQTEPAVFDMLEGSWMGHGTLMGSSASFSMTWEVDGPFATLRFQNATVDDDGGETTVLQAVATYRTAGSPEGVWLDSRGVRIELTWQERDSALVVTWTAPDETGRTTYRSAGPGAVEVVDEVVSDGTWTVFSRAEYMRSAAHRSDTDFVEFPIHQPGFVVPDVEAAVALAVSLGGRQEGDLVMAGDVVVGAAVRDPDGNTVELSLARR